MPVFARLHQATTQIGAAIAACCVAATAAIYSAEVVARYFLNAPLNWSGDISSYLLCVCAFLALPKVTSDGGHVAITYVLERVSAAARVRYAYALHRVTGLVCLATGIFIAIEGVHLYNERVLTTQATQIPKWVIAMFACFGLVSSALHLFYARGDTLGKESEL